VSCVKTAVFVALFFQFLGGRQQQAGDMADVGGYEIVQGESGWVLRGPDRMALVEFPTRRHALRAGIAVSRDEGLARLVIRRADGRIEVIDPLVQSLEAVEA
jgi:hypothetical protein